jgi:hypothetical protein
MDDKIEKIIEKITDVDEADTIEYRGTVNAKNDARTQPRDKPEPLNKEDSYDEWIKRQPKSKAIGYHKNKKTPIKK